MVPPVFDVKEEPSPIFKKASSDKVIAKESLFLKVTLFNIKVPSTPNIPR